MDEKLLGQGNTAEIYQYAQNKILKLFRLGLAKEIIEREYQNSCAVSELLGNNMPFVMNSSTAVDKTSYRQFNNFLEAADENADSRVMAGIHFRFASAAGQQMGNKIGEWVVNNYCRPAK